MVNSRLGRMELRISDLRLLVSGPTSWQHVIRRSGKPILRGDRAQGGDIGADDAPADGLALAEGMATREVLFKTGIIVRSPDTLPADECEGGKSTQANVGHKHKRKASQS